MQKTLKWRSRGLSRVKGRQEEDKRGRQWSEVFHHASGELEMGDLYSKGFASLGRVGRP